MTTDSMRKRAYDGGAYDSYWTRSPNHMYSNYVYQVDQNGQMYGFSTPYTQSGVLIEISF